MAVSKMKQCFRGAACAAITIVLLAGLAGCPTAPPTDDNGDNGGGDTPVVTCVALSTTSFDTDTTLPAGCYIAESSVSVNDGATLTLDPGVTIKFQQNVEMTVSAGGKLSAVGTAAEPIVLTGEEEIRGYWGGLRFYQSNSTVNQLDYVTIEYGGGYHNANLYLDGTSSSPVRLSITNCLLQNSESYGFDFDDDTVIEEFNGNTVTGNTLGAGYVSAEVAGYLDDTSTYTGNDRDVVEVWGGTVKTEKTWAGIDGDYLISGSLSVSAALTVSPGAQLVFEAGQEMSVYSDGSLAAVGTADRPIVLTGEEETRGYWGGLRFYQSNSTANQLDYVTIEYGGGYHNANLYLDGTSSSPVRLSMTNCLLQGSDTYGFDFDDNTIIEEFSGNTITGNTLGAGYASAEVVGYLDDTSTYTGNDKDVVEIWGGTVKTEKTWAGIDGDYLISGSVAVSAPLTVSPGAQLVFEGGQEMSVYSDGSLAAVGTADQPIVFTGEGKTSGYWGGLRFYQSNSALNQLDYVTIEYGGGYHRANLYLDGSSSSPVTLDVTNSTFRGSAEWGIYADTDTTLNEDAEDANAFVDNVGGDYFHEV